MLEIKILISNEEESYIQKHLVYDEDVTLCKEDPKLQKLVNDAIKNFKGNVDDVILRIKMIW
jgi:hypothetical protein